MGASDVPAATRRPSCSRRRTRAVARLRVSPAAPAIGRSARTHRPSSRSPPAWGDRSNCRPNHGHHSERPRPAAVHRPAVPPTGRWDGAGAAASIRRQPRLPAPPSTGPWAAHRCRCTARSHRCTRAPPRRTAASPLDRRRGPRAGAACAVLPSGPAPVAPTPPHAATTRFRRRGSGRPPMVPRCGGGRGFPRQRKSRHREPQ